MISNECNSEMCEILAVLPGHVSVPAELPQIAAGAWVELGSRTGCSPQ